jgi:hypothetical protein
MTKFDRFDIVSAHYCFCALHYAGQWCPLYRRLCKIIISKIGFRPGMFAADPDSLTENAREIYDQLATQYESRPAR